MALKRQNSDGILKAIAKPRRGRPPNIGRRDEIIVVAGQLFMQYGFQATTMDRIAANAGISKLTLYNRFRNKDEVFAAVIEQKCEQYIPKRFFAEFEHGLPQDSLYNIGYGFLSLLTSEEAMNIERILMAEAKHKKKLTQIFNDAGPIPIKKMIAEHLSQLDAAGILSVPNAILSTHMFVALFRGSEICFRLSMNIPPKPSKKEIENYCRSAVHMFMKAHES